MDEIVDEVYEAVDWAKKEAENKELPLFLVGESFGAVQVLSAAFDCLERNVHLTGVVILGGLIRPAKEVLPPTPVIKILIWLSKYYSKFKMPAANYSETFDEAFGDKEWAKVARSDPMVNVSPQFTLGATASILSGGETLLGRASAFPVPLLAIHGSRDCRTQCEAVQEFVDQVGTKAEIMLIDTNGHQLLQDKPDVTDLVIDKVATWMREKLA
jgi:alpha-beta hydrolase superfamily lysophospholipase